LGVAESPNGANFTIKIHFTVFVDKHFSIDLFDVKKKMIHAAIPIWKLVFYIEMSLLVVLV
jgi:hypothetical protein